MAEELGKIEKPAVSEFLQGRKLYFVPLLYDIKEFPAAYLEKLDHYWQQVEEQISDLELKLGPVSRIYHEFISAAGADGMQTLQDYNPRSGRIAEARMAKGATLETLEDAEILTEFMDWHRCIIIGLQSPKVVTQVYASYTEVSRKRDETIARRIEETLRENEIAILFMREGHQVQFPAGIDVFYVAPPALDEINRWLRDWQAAPEPGQEDGSAEK